MKKKIIGIFVCMLMIVPVLATTTIAEKRLFHIKIGRITDLVVEENIVSYTNIKVTTRTYFADGSKGIGHSVYPLVSEYPTDEYEIQGLLRPNFILIILKPL